MENKSGVESWCVSCPSSPKGCGELGFLHILMLLKIWRRGAFLSSGVPPALLLSQRALLRSAFPPLFWPEEPGAGTLQLEGMPASPLAFSEAAGGLSRCLASGAMAAQVRDVRLFPNCFFGLGVLCSCLLNWAFGLVLGERTFSFMKAALCFPGIHKSSFHCGPKCMCPEGGGGGRKASQTLAPGSLLALHPASQACAHPRPLCSRAAQRMPSLSWDKTSSKAGTPQEGRLAGVSRASAEASGLQADPPVSEPCTNLMQAPEHPGTSPSVSLLPVIMLDALGKRCACHRQGTPGILGHPINGVTASLRDFHSIIFASPGEPALFYQNGYSLKLELWPLSIQFHSHLIPQTESREIPGKDPDWLSMGRVPGPTTLAMAIGVVQSSDHN